MRPKAIIFFERATIGILILSIIQLGIFFLTYRAGVPASFIAAMIVVFFLTYVLLRLIVRRRSKVAIWIFLVLIIPSGILTLWGIYSNRVVSILNILTIFETMVQLSACILLFTTQSRRWLNRVDDEISEVFL
jgi:hypothetical protein